MRASAFLVLVSLSLYSLSQEKKKREYGDGFEYRRPGIFRLYTGLVAPDENSAPKFDRLNTAVFWNSWMGETNNTKTAFYAIGHDLNLMFDLPFGKRSPVGIGIGLGYSHFCIRNNGEFSFNSSPFGEYSSLAVYTGPKRWINRTVFNFVDVPFEIRFRGLRERKKFKFYPGFKFSIMVEDFSKWRIQDKEFKEFNFPDLNRIHYGPSLRIGLDNVMLWAYYDLAPVFKNENSSQLNLFGAGISIGWF